jgi:hypothetical protein
MSTFIFMCFATKLVGLHHVDQGWLELESFFYHIDCWSSPDVGSGWSGEFMESLVSHGFEHWCQTSSWLVFFWQSGWGFLFPELGSGFSDYLF